MTSFEEVENEFGEEVWPVGLLRQVLRESGLRWSVHLSAGDGCDVGHDGDAVTHSRDDEIDHVFFHPLINIGFVETEKNAKKIF